MATAQLNGRPSPQPSPPGRGGTSVAAWKAECASTRRSLFGDRVRARCDGPRVIELRRVTVARSGDKRSTLSPGERAGVRAVCHDVTLLLVATKFSEHSEMPHELFANRFRWKGKWEMIPGPPSPRPSPPGRGGTSVAALLDGCASTRRSFLVDGVRADPECSSPYRVG